MLRCSGVLARVLHFGAFSSKIGLMNTKAFAIWFTGLSGSGKTTLCNSVASELHLRGIQVQILDGDEIRKSLCSDLGFSMRDRCENIRRIATVADLLVRNGIVVVVATISPLHSMRRIAKEQIDSLIEIFVDAPLDVCEARDPRGLYKRARAGDLPGFTGIESAYEPPLLPDIVCRTNEESIIESTSKVVDAALAYRVSGLSVSEPLEDVGMDPPRTIAVDFDGVIADYDGWRGRNVFGAPRSDVVESLKTLKAEGWKIIVHTTRRGADIADYLQRNVIPFDEINSDGGAHTVGCKPRAKVYWDDRALTYSGNARIDIDLIRNFRTWNGRS